MSDGDEQPTLAEVEERYPHLKLPDVVRQQLVEAEEQEAADREEARASGADAALRRLGRSTHVEVPTEEETHRRVRRNDPAESREAAANLINVTERQRAVYYVIDLFGPLTDEELVERYSNMQSVPRQSESGIRTRRSELAKMGKVYRFGSKRLPSGRHAATWAVHSGTYTPGEEVTE